MEIMKYSIIYEDDVCGFSRASKIPFIVYCSFTVITIPILYIT